MLPRIKKTITESRYVAKDQTKAVGITNETYKKKNNCQLIPAKKNILAIINYYTIFFLEKIGYDTYVRLVLLAHIIGYFWPNHPIILILACQQLILCMSAISSRTHLCRSSSYV